MEIIHNEFILEGMIWSSTWQFKNLFIKIYLLTCSTSMNCWNLQTWAVENRIAKTMVSKTWVLTRMSTLLWNMVFQVAPILPLLSNDLSDKWKEYWRFDVIHTPMYLYHVIVVIGCLLKYHFSFEQYIYRWEVWNPVCFILLIDWC